MYLDIDVIESNENSHGIKATYAFMEGNDKKVIDILMAGIKANPTDQLLWKMNMDMLRVINDQNNYDQLSIKYAERFDISPPAWVPIPVMEDLSEKNSDATVKILTVTKATMAQPVATAIETVGNGGTITFDFENVGNSDKDGLLMLNSGLVKIVEMRGNIQFLNAEKFIIAISGHAKTSGKTLIQLWEMSLLMMRVCGMADLYEEFSLNYAEAFEEMAAVWVEYVPSSKDTRGKESESNSLKPIEGAIPVVGNVSSISQADINKMSMLVKAGKLLLDMRACTRLSLFPAEAISELLNVSTRPIIVTGANTMVKHSLMYSKLLPMETVIFKEA